MLIYGMLLFGLWHSVQHLMRAGFFVKCPREEMQRIVVELDADKSDESQHS